MFKLQRTLLALSFCFGALACQASQTVKANKPQPNNAKDIESLADSLDIPVQTLHAFQDKEGKMMYMLDNGRFVIIGDFIDVWNRQILKDVQQIRKAVQIINVEKVGLDVKALNAITLGNGQKEVVIFIDPYCHWCHLLLNEIKADKEKLKEYTFKIIPVPLLRTESQDLVKRLYCSTASDTERLEALLKGEEEVKKLPQNKACKQDGLRQLAISMKALNLNSVPFIIAPDGRFATGKPRDLTNFLTGK